MATLGDLGTILNTSEQEAEPKPTSNNDERVQKILRRHKQMKREKQPWLHVYQICGEYIFLRRQDFTKTIMSGQFLTGRIFDSTAPRVLHKMVAALIGATWPAGKRKFRFKPPASMSKEVANSEDVKQYFTRAASVITNTLMEPLGGLDLALEECFNDLGAFGISGVGAFEGEDDNVPVQYMPFDTKKITIDEGKRGIDVVYIEKEITVRQLIQEYGVQQVHESRRDAYEQGKVEEKVVVLHALEPRMEETPWTFGNRSFPIASIHIDVNKSHIMKESGYYEMPVFVARFYKAMSEKYGRSPGMEAIPDILELNAMREATIVAAEKMLNPPLAVTQSGADGGSTINTSAGGISVRTVNGRIGEGNNRWIEPIITVGNMAPVNDRIEAVTKVIEDTFFMDRLTDLNNESRMTLGEAQIREKLRGQTLGSVFARLNAELFTPLIQRTFNILLLKGLLGVAEDSAEAQAAYERDEEPFLIPAPILDLMISGKNVYDIEYLTPAARIMRAEELVGIQQVTGFLEQLAPTNPNVFDNIDMDLMVQRVVELTGAPEDIVMTTEAMTKLRRARSQAQQQAQAVEQGHIQAQTSRGYGQAMQAAAKAGVPPQAMLPQQGQQPPQPPERGTA